jgi:peptidoglycan/xylan/chitin deacetylase (PgdA/CDA1 family)
MKFYWVKTKRLIKLLFNRYTWSIPTGKKTVYLTFDDGPTPGVTEFILDTLREHHIKATFFLIGKNVAQNPDLFKRLITEGHRIGNHTHNHLNGWHTPFDKYIADTRECEDTISEFLTGQPLLFRPPYGKCTRKQATYLINKGYKIIMWDILTADFDTEISPEQCLKNATNEVSDGSIIIFHDSVKASPNMRYALPAAIAILKERGYKFGLIS